MKLDDGTIRLSASDLSNHVACRRLTELDRAYAEKRLDAQPWHDPAAAHLQERGRAHEDAYVAHLRALGRDVVDLRGAEGDPYDRTIAAMRAGHDEIVQAQLARGRWLGYADVLERVELESELGAWSYEVVDTKLAQETKGGAVLQLAFYSDLVARIQGVPPRKMHVVKPGAPFECESFRVDAFSAYYRLLARRLEETVDAAPGDRYPDPCEHCAVCRWWRVCDAQRRADDHPTLVAGLGCAQATELARQGRPTLAAFAEALVALDDEPRRGSRATYERLHEQARVQLEGRRAGALVSRLVDHDPGHGLALLPEPSAGDVFFDIEADHFYEGGGLEYLFGLSWREKGAPVYERFWALDRDEERRAFERLVDLCVARLERWPDMHVYHFAPYEKAALGRLMNRHGTRETEVDRLLRAERLVDLHAVARQGLRASVESYSLKELEHFAGYARTVHPRDAAAERRALAWSLERGERDGASAARRAIIETYNREDCEATAALRDWLEERRAELVASGVAVERPVEKVGEADEKVARRHAEIALVGDALRALLPEDRKAWSAEHCAVALLAELVWYFVREDRCAWWEFFRLRDLEDPGERERERKVVEGLTFDADLGRPTKRARTDVHRYRYPPQEVAIKLGTTLHDFDGVDVGTLVAHDPANGTIDVKRTTATQATHPRGVFAFESVRAGSVERSLLALGRSVAAHGVDGDGPHRAARMLLLKRAPALRGGGSMREHGEESLDAARRVVRLLDGDVLAIQGPPGTGKTYTGARMIVDLVRAGKRVGITAVSHKVIRNLAKEALDWSRDPKSGGSPLEAALLNTKGDDEAPVDGLRVVSKDAEALDALDQGQLVGGTAWLWSSDDAALDVLFVDEAGQLSLAHTLAAARCATNVVLLGDPQQLQQPQQAAHPEGAEIAALEHFLDGEETMPAHKGLFLERTYRLHPAICSFTSELYYERKLESHPDCEQQALIGAARFSESGLWHLPCEHEGCQSRSDEEVDAVVALVEELLAGGVSWRDRNGVVRPLTPADVLVVAPYNAQVGALAARLERLRVPAGTVDLFQGREAPVVIYSLASSSIVDAPRGLEFLLDPHRMNVATSRAQCVCVLVASPRLVEAVCRTPRQMEHANGLCAYLERALVH